MPAPLQDPPAPQAAMPTAASAAAPPHATHAQPAPPLRDPNAPLPWPGVAWVDASPHALAKGPVRKKIAPGQPGAGRWSERFGHHLVCVRYRDDLERQRRVVTVELLVDERPLRARPTPSKVGVQLDAGELAGRQRAMRAGGRWHSRLRLWVMTRAQARKAGLEHRITEADLGPDPFSGKTSPA